MPEQATYTRYPAHWQEGDGTRMPTTGPIAEWFATHFPDGFVVLADDADSCLWPAFATYQLGGAVPPTATFTDGPSGEDAERFAVLDLIDCRFGLLEFGCTQEGGSVLAVITDHREAALEAVGWFVEAAQHALCDAAGGACYCTSAACGALVPQGARYCPRCGERKAGRP